MANDDYNGMLMRIREARHERESRQRFDEIAQEHAESAQQRHDAVQSGDSDSIDFYGSECERLEREYHQLQQAQQPQLTPEQIDWLRPYAGEMHKPHWSGVTHPNGRPATNWDATLHAHQQAVANGHQPGSNAYFAFLDALSPREQDNTILSGDDALQMCRNSKYGADLEARTYNRNAVEGYKVGLLGRDR
jgi:hypothetical protein